MAQDGTRATAPQGRFGAAVTKKAKLRQRFPTVEYLREHARSRIPKFGFDALDGGAGADGCVKRNAAALDGIELMPRYGGVQDGTCSLETELFGRRYKAPFGVAPMGMTGIVWPGAEKYMAAAASRARIPYVASTVASGTIEELAALAEGSLWFQLYRLAHEDHASGLHLVRRAQAAEAHVLVMTLDVPVRTKRPREVRRGLVLPFKLHPHTIWDVVTSPTWLLAYLRNGLPRFGNYRAYVDAPTDEAVGRFAASAGGAFTWAEVARYRDVWRGPLVVKGILHPEDAKAAVSLGVDGVQVSNHGGRQIEGLPAAIDLLPAIVAEVGDRATVLMDGGIRSGLDVLRALTLGAKAAFVGRGFLYALGAIGGDGPEYLIDLLKEEMVETMRQVGIRSVADVSRIEYRHPTAWSFAGTDRDERIAGKASITPAREGC